VIIRLFGVIENISEVALSAVLTVVHSSHEDTGTALEKERNIISGLASKKRKRKAKLHHR
jgi:hypothetical protein